MARKIVGITCATAPKMGMESARQTLNRPYVWAVEQAGGVPLLIPATTFAENASAYLSVLDGLLLSGGVDVAPACYGEEPHPELGEVDADRDSIEIPLTRLALAQDLPVFAICRGMQVLNIALGGTLFQDIPSERPSWIQHQQRYAAIPRHCVTHTLHIEEKTRLHQIVGGSRMATNSFHHQALKQIGEGLSVTAHAADGTVEAVESAKHRYVLGVQFHPEETASVDLNSRLLFEDFVRAL
jgi:putative glutamine amidotransferase